MKKLPIFEDISELLKQIGLGDDSVLELKTITLNNSKVASPHRNSMADELAAMANTAAGVIVLGVDDKTRQIKGIPLDHLDIVEGWVRSIC